MKILILSSFLFSILITTSVIFAAWTPPVGMPSISTNTPPPLNLSSLDQVKEGGLSVKTLMVDGTVLIQGGISTATATGAVGLQVEGKIGADQFCTENGGVCFTASEVITLIASSTVQ